MFLSVSSNMALSNIKVNSILDNRYSEYFGFTSEEVQEMTEYYGTPEKYGELCEWYDGYRFGKTEIFNPWSVIGYFNNECIPRAFWQSTGSNDIISDVLSNATIETYVQLESFLLQTISFHDAANETFYHGLILGLCAMLDNQYHITSNREAGNGRFDIQMFPLNKKLPGILIELKAGKECTEVQLDELAETALKQINDRQYHVDMSAQGVKEILQYGIAFSGKNASVKAEVRKAG